ncbi:MAG: response regulator, partial [Acidobacteriota bacterium]
IASRLGAGTTISVFFPESRWVSRPTVEPSAASVAPAAIDAAESVPVLLLVEDQETVRLLVSEILEDLGWRVHRAVDGLDGWRRWQELPQVDAVFLDRCMPGLSGDEVLRRIRAEDTEVPIIVSSGFGETALAELVPKGASGVLPKPFSVTQLLTLMRSLGLSVDDDA